MPFGWTGKFLAVDLSSGEAHARDTMPYTEKYIGGRGFAARLAWEEIPVGIDAYDPQNRIIIATGPFTGTLTPTSGRTVMSAISPRTHPAPWYTHSTLGGWFGPELKYAGFDAIVIRGRSSNPVYLSIVDEEVCLVDAQDLWGVGCRETQLKLRDTLGGRFQVLTIGPAGENLASLATVAHAEENAAGHSGFGAVWGSKNLKAIAVLGTGSVAVAHPEALLSEILAGGTTYRISTTTNVDRPSVATRNQTPNPICSQACTFDCQSACYARGGEGRRVPAFCIGSCWVGELGVAGTFYKGGGVKVPAARGFEPAMELDLYERCNDLGLDLWWRLSMQPWLMRCAELGIHAIREHEIEPDDSAWFGSFMRQLACAEGLGALFAHGLRRAVDELEGELPTELILLGQELEFNFGFAAHREGRFWDAEPSPFWIISAMMHVGESRDPTIGTHMSSMLLANMMLLDRDVALRQFRALAEKVWGCAEALQPTYENKAPVAVWSQNQHMLIDCLPLCDFGFPMLVRPFDSREQWQQELDICGDLDIDRRLFRAVTGKDWSRQELDAAAERAFNLERIMLARAGRSRSVEEAYLASHFKLPCRDDGTLVDDAGFARLLDEYFNARGWDPQDGWPQEELLSRLGLDDAVPEIRESRRSLRKVVVEQQAPKETHGGER